jgi:hypothetical protein
MKKRHLVMGALSALGALTMTGAAGASSHREAPAISNDPAADNTDLWAWVSDDRSKLYVVSSYIPLEEPSGGPNFHKFDDEVLYEVHIARGPTSLDDELTYQIRFKTTYLPNFNDPPTAGLDAGPDLYGVTGGKEFFAQLTGYFHQTYTVSKIVKGQAPVAIATGIPVAPPNIGPRTQATLNAVAGAAPFWSQDSYTDLFAATFIKDLGTGGAEGRTWAGPRDDGFYVDLGGIFDLANLRQPAPPLPTPLPANVAQDSLAGYNCHTIALEIPTTKLTVAGTAPAAGASDANTLGIWASASRRKVRVLRGNGTDGNYGPWVQVSRVGLPLINEAIIGLKDKDKYNRTRPKTDAANFAPYFLNPVIVRDAGAVKILTPIQVNDNKSNRTDIIDLINLKGTPTAGAHNIMSIGDVLRVDLGFRPSEAGFPNGRVIPAGQVKETDVTDVELSFLLTKSLTSGQGGTLGVQDGVYRNDATYLAGFPFLAKPWSGYSEGHGKVARP